MFSCCLSIALYRRCRFPVISNNHMTAGWSGGQVRWGLQTDEAHKSFTACLPDVLYIVA